jgi:diguanylate cyclase (GGDEF)-like protein
LLHQITKNSKKIVQFFILLLIVISVSFVSYSEYRDTLAETTNKLNKKMINFHIETFSKLSDIYLKDTNNNFIQNVIQKKKLRKNFEDMLHLISISTVQNLFVVTRDKNKNYFILLDSDRNPKTRSNLFEPFDPLSDFWDLAYTYQTPQVFHHKKSKELWITIAYPIVQNNKTVAIIGADISHQLDLKIQTNLHNFGTFFFWIILLGIGWSIVLYFITIYFRQKMYEGYIDSLTLIYNRKYLNEVLMKKLSRSYQLFMIDIDFFKKVNDTYGHDAGDYVLKEVASRMDKLVRSEDSFIRYGGEEFLIYTTKLSPKNSIEFAERLRVSIEQEPIRYKDITCLITISIGVNPSATNRELFSDMLKKADEALYQAKSDGRNCVRVIK